MDNSDGWVLACTLCQPSVDDLTYSGATMQILHTFSSMLDRDIRV